MCRQTEDEVRPTVRFPSHRHFLPVVLFNLPVQASTQAHPFYGYSKKIASIQSSNRTYKGIRRTYSHLKLGSPRGRESRVYGDCEMNYFVESGYLFSILCRPS